MSELLTIEEAAYRLGVSLATARRWAADGKIPASKSGKQWIVDGSSLSRHRRRRPAPARATVDLARALQHVRHTDLTELPVPDVLRHADALEHEDAILAAARTRLEGAPVGPAVEVEVDKTAIFTRRMTLFRLEDLVAFQAAVASFADRVEMATPDQVFSARLSQNPRYFLEHGPKRWVAWREAVQKQLVPGAEWMVATDLTSYFDTIPHRSLIAEIESLNVDAAIVNVLREMLSSWSSNEGFGLPQGPNASRLLGNLYLLPVDRAMLNSGWTYTRFLDDIRIVTSTRAEAVQAIRQFQAECRVRGLIVSSSKTELLHGAEARKSLMTSGDLAEADYLMNISATSLARTQLKSILRNALKHETRIDVRRARFSLWRLAKLREAGVLGRVLKRLEDLAPIATVVAAYLQPFISRKSVVQGLTKFLGNSERSYSGYLVAWLMAAQLEHPGTPPASWVDEAMRRLKNRNEPPFLRAIAAVLVARGNRTADIAWIKRDVHNEHDPAVLRGYAVGLHWVRQLDRSTQKQLVGRSTDLQKTISYLEGRSRIPSLIYVNRYLSVSR